MEKQKKQSRTKKKETNETSVLKAEGAHNESERKLTNAIKFFFFLSFSFSFYLLLLPLCWALIYLPKKYPLKEAEKETKNIFPFLITLPMQNILYILFFFSLFIFPDRNEFFSAAFIFPFLLSC